MKEVSEGEIKDFSVCSELFIAQNTGVFRSYCVDLKRLMVVCPEGMEIIKPGTDPLSASSKF